MSTDTAPSTVFDEALSRSRQSGAGSLASIWAPQPQLLDTTWPKALDSFSRAAESETQLATRPELQNHSGPMITREDVFGPSPPKDMPSVGAIGDGRKKVTPDFEPHTVCIFLFVFTTLFFNTTLSTLNNFYGLWILIPQTLIISIKSPRLISASKHLLVLPISLQCPSLLLSLLQPTFLPPGHAATST